MSTENKKTEQLVKIELNNPLIPTTVSSAFLIG